MAVWATIAEPKVVTDGEDALPGAGRRAFWFGLIVVLLSLFSGLATYLILTGLTPIQPRNDVVVLVLFFNIVLMVLMVAIIGWQAFGLWRAWQLKIAGARLHVRIVALFSVLAALPVILLATSATITFSRSLDNWFTTRTQAIVGNSLEVAKAYLREHGQVIRTDIVNMAKDLDDAAANLRANQARLQALVLAQAGLRDLPIAYILAADGSVVVKGIDDIKVPYVKPSARAFALADKGQVPLLLPEQTYRVAALVKLENFAGRYLYVARRVNPKVIRQVRLTEQGVADFQRLMRSRSGLKIAHGMMYFMISLTVLLAAIWVGLWFAGRLVAPIRRLIGAAQDVSRGNLRVQLPIRRGEGDLRRLSSTFNHMTSELRSQRDLLVNANAQLTERRRFMEAVLSGVTAGVIGLDRQGQVRLVNRSAERLLASREVDLVDKPLAELVPEFAEVLEPVSDTHDDPGPARAAAKGARAIEQVTMTIDGDERTFALRLTREQSGDDSEGWVVTFDDITELVIAQRTSAWADVARRIAHEIKNPLTPIQLSAERIRRRYGKVLTEDREVFDKCTDTIIRQVDVVARMVDEFSAFARMPKPEMSLNDIIDVVRGPVDLQQLGNNANIAFDIDFPAAPVTIQCDPRMINQVITNLVKNASEAVEAKALKDDTPADYRGRIGVSIVPSERDVVIEVVDNGIGLPKANRGRLTEPYITHREKGTGLGLAIVLKVIEQHGGKLALEDAPLNETRTSGALIRITLPRPDPTTTSPEPSKREAPQPAATTLSPAR